MEWTVCLDLNLIEASRNEKEELKIWNTIPFLSYKLVNKNIAVAMIGLIKNICLPVPLKLLNFLNIITRGLTIRSGSTPAMRPS